MFTTITKAISLIMKSKTLQKLLKIFSAFLLSILLFLIVISGFFITKMSKNLDESEKAKLEELETSNLVECSGGNPNGKGYGLWEQNAKGGKLEGKSKVIVKIAKKHKIPPTLFMAIIASESQWGKGDNALIQNNPLSVMGAGPLRVFPTIEDGLEAGAKNLYDLYISEGLNTPQKIGPKYAPVGAANDPKNLNNNWIPVVSQIMKSLNGSKVECTTIISEGKDFNLDGSKLPKILSPKSYNYKPTYPWGQCTWYVHQRRKQIGKDVGLLMGNGGDWDTNARLQGFKVGKVPKVGSAVSMPHGSFGSTLQYGHIAFVEKVNKDGSFIVSEANVKGLGVISFRKFTKAEGQRMDFIYDK